MSDTTPEMLDEHVLAQLEGQWRRLGATTPEAMEPGLSDVEIDEIGTPLGFVVPEEVRRLFRWHNGSRLRPFVACRTLIDLRASVQETVHHREKDEWWGPNWLKVMDEKPYIIFDCSGPCDAPVPVWHHDYEFGYPTRPVFPSIGEMFRFWINLMDEGLMYWEAPTWKLRRPLLDDIDQKIGGVPTD